MSGLLSLSMVLVTGFMLFNVSQQVQESERQLKKAQREIAREEEMVRVLRAEWAYLNRPDRLEALAAQYLGMEHMDSDAVMVTPASLPQKRLYMPPPSRPNQGFVSARYDVSSSKLEAVPSIKKVDRSDDTFRSVLDGLMTERGER